MKIKLTQIQSFIFLLFTLLFSSSTHAAQNNPPCQLPPETMQALTNGIWSTPMNTIPPQCHGNYISFTLPPNPNPIHYELSIPHALFEEKFPFDGLAQFYNGSRPLQFTSTNIDYLDFPIQKTVTEPDLWLGLKGRFNIFMISAPGAEIDLTQQKLQLQWPSQTPIVLQIYLGNTEGEFATIRYSNLWNWLSALCRGFESLLSLLHTLLWSNWGLAIIGLAIMIKIALLPLSLFVMKLQRQVSHYQTLLDPKLREIKAHYDGEEAHNRIMAEYKQLGITPFYTLKPMIGVLILVPILVVISNVLGEMPELAGAAFLWIHDLAYPDTLATLPFTVPMLGNTFNLLPFLMALVTFLATILFQNRHAPAATVKKQKYSLYLMVGAFFILFYPFPAALVLFWTINNLLQGIQQQLVKL